MKSKILFLIVFLINIPIISFSQDERQDVIRQKPKLNLTGFSDKLTNITGWSNIETKEGKIWKQSDSTPKKSYLPAYPNYKFESMQMFEFEFQGVIFHFVYIKYQDDEKKIFAITNSSLEELKKTINISDGQAVFALEIVYCKSVIEDFDPESEIKDKAILSALIQEKNVGYGDILSKSCKGSRLFTLRTAKVNGETYVRFQMLGSNQSGISETPNTSLAKDYFEIKKRDFEKFYTFSNDLDKLKEQLAKEKEEKRKEQERLENEEKQRIERLISKFKQRVDSINSYSYLNNEFMNSDDAIVGSDRPTLLSKGEFGYCDLTSVEAKKEYVMVIGSKGKIINAPVMKDFFEKIEFQPGSVTYDYKDYGESTDHRWCEGTCVTLPVNMQIALTFNQKEERIKNGSEYKDFPSGYKPELGHDVIIFKLKKSKEGIQVLNTFYSDTLFYNEIKPQLNFDIELAKYSKQTWYFYYVRDYTKWCINFGGRAENSKYDDKALLKFIKKEKDWQKIILFNPSDPDRNCP